jgi:hypothetical protein
VAKPRAALRAIGLERFAPPLLIAGRVDLDLAVYLTDDNAKTLEQEELDPEMPE